jgi:cell division protein FtsQ
MDGGRRLLQSINGLEPALAAPRAFAGAFAAAAAPRKTVSRDKLITRSRPRPRASWGEKVQDVLCLPGLGLGLGVLFLASVGLYGAKFGGEYDQFVRDNGAPRDIVARALGFGVNADRISIGGQTELTRAQILQTAGVDDRQSLVFLDADSIRKKLLALPLVKNASVSKLFPDRLVIEIVERRPFGLWQKDGVVNVIAPDGAPIDTFRDDRFAGLPFVVGDGANTRIDEFVGLINASGGLREKIRAGILVSQRRWTLKMTSGVEVMLPEADPKAAVERLVQLEQERNILEKDVVSLDFRVPGKMYVRLTEEAAAAREATKSHKGGRS